MLEKNQWEVYPIHSSSEISFSSGQFRQRRTPVTSELHISMVCSVKTESQDENAVSEISVSKRVLNDLSGGTII